MAVEGATITVKSNLKLYPWQRQVVDTLDTHRKGYIHVVKSKRQCGKSIMLESILIQTAINKAGSTSICLSPTLEQARKVFREVKNVLKPTKIYSRHNDLQLIIMLKNKSWIYFKSAEQRDGLRGYTVNGIYVIDEAAYIPDDIFYDTLAWVNVSLAPVVIVSTPNHKTGFFYKYYMMGEGNEPNVFSYNWSEFDTSALLPDDKLEEYRKQLPATKFKTEFLGEFLDLEGGVFGSFDSIILDKAIKAAGLHVMLLKFNTTNESKERLINNFQVAIQNKEVTILDNNTLKIEMDMYEMKVNQNGKRTYNAASGYHDDCVMAMLMALDCISKGTYFIR